MCTGVLRIIRDCFTFITSPAWDIQRAELIPSQDGIYDTIFFESFGNTCAPHPSSVGCRRPRHNSKRWGSQPWHLLLWLCARPHVSVLVPLPLPLWTTIVIIRNMVDPKTVQYKVLDMVHVVGPSADRGRASFQSLSTNHEFNHPVDARCHITLLSKVQKKAFIGV